MSPPFDRRAIPAEAIESQWLAPDGWPVRRIDWPMPEGAYRGALLFMPGRGDFYEKYLETLDHWHRCGWRVTALDWRGQAGSGRLGSDEVTGHIDDFATWIGDLAAFWRDWKAASEGPHVLAGHSMGGHLTLRAVAEKAVDPDALVLCAPMLGFHPGWVPVNVLHGVARLMCAIGDRRRPAWKWSEKPGQVPEARISLLTHDAERYGDEIRWRELRPELSTGPGSWGWVEASYASMRVLAQGGMLENVSTPVLIEATPGDLLVEIGAIERAARRLPRAQLVRFEREARHELWREEDGIRDRAIGAVDEFLDRVAPRID